MKPVVLEFENCIQRSHNMTLEQKSAGATTTTPLVDMIPEEWKNKFGTFKLTIEFSPNEEG